MTQPGYSHITLLSDRSGSIKDIESDVNGGIKTYVTEQQEVPGKCTISLHTFDDVFDVAKDFIDIKDWGEYLVQPRGLTALLDAMARSINLTGERLAALPEDERPEHVLFVVSTDGLENASEEFAVLKGGRERIFDMVRHQEETYGWVFVYLAAGQDAIGVGQSMGFQKGRAMNYTPQSVGSSYAVASASTTSLRGGHGYTSMPEDAPDDN